MYININLEQFRTAFATHCGGQYANQFTYEGLECLFNYIEMIEGDELADDFNRIELDVIAFSCDYAEYTYEELAGILQADANTSNEDLVSLLEERTVVCGTTPDAVICCQF